MRPSCLWCTAKHLANALILFREAASSDKYFTHIFIAFGELEQASQESEEGFKFLSKEIYRVKKKIETDMENNKLPLDTSEVFLLLEDVSQTIKDLIDGPKTVSPVSSQSQHSNFDVSL